LQHVIVFQRAFKQPIIVGMVQAYVKRNLHGVR
jgi:hypothetical protein